jgi:hypothetical protein
MCRALLRVLAQVAHRVAFVMLPQSMHGFGIGYLVT